MASSIDPPRPPLAPAVRVLAEAALQRQNWLLAAPAAPTMYTVSRRWRGGAGALMLMSMTVPWQPSPQSSPLSSPFSTSSCARCCAAAARSAIATRIAFLSSHVT